MRVGLPSVGSASAMLERWIGISLVMMPPWRARRLLLVAPHQVDAAHHRAVLGRQHHQHLALLAAVAAGDDDDVVALADALSHQSTSGASEMIFMWFFALSSRGTGPKMRVPTGSD